MSSESPLPSATVRFSRRGFLIGAAGLASACTLSAWTGPLAHAAVADVRSRPFTDTLLGTIALKPVLRGAVGFAWSKTRSACLVTAYAEGVEARLTVIHAETGEILATEGPFVTTDDSASAVSTLPDRQMVTLTASGLLLHTNPDTLVTTAYRGSTTDARRSAPLGQMSTVTRGGPGKSYVGTRDGGLFRFALPGSPDASYNPWYSFGPLYPAGAAWLRSTEFYGGYLYIAVRGGAYTGVYRIAERALDEAALGGRTLTLSSFQKVDLGNDGRGGPVTVPQDQIELYQLLVVPKGGVPRLLVRLSGSTWNQLEISSIGTAAPKFGPQVTWYQPLILDPADQTRVYGRTHSDTLPDGTRVYNLSVFNPLSPGVLQHVAYIAGGQVYPGTPIVYAQSARRGAFPAMDRIHVPTLVEPQSAHLPKTAPLTTIGSESIRPPLQGAPLRALGRIPATSATPERILFGPRWTDLAEVGVIDVLSTGVPRPPRIIQQSAFTLESRGSLQIESFSASGGRAVIGTYPSGGLHSLDPAGSAVASDRKVLVKTAPASPLGGQGDSAAARPVVQASLPDGRVAVGMIGAFNHPSGGGVTVYDPAAMTVNAYSSAQVAPQQNITALEFLPAAGSRPATVLCGSNARLEHHSSTTDPVSDAFLVAFSYSAGRLAARRVIPLPDEAKAVWDITRTADGRVFALVQYPLYAGSIHAPVFLLELDPVTLSPLTEGNGPDGRGVYIWYGRGEFSSLGQILIQNPTQLIVRVNVLVFAVGIAPGLPGAQSATRLTSDPGPYMGNLVIAGNGDWYYINNTYTAVVRRVWG